MADVNVLEAIAAEISDADRELIFNDPGRVIRRSKIEIIPDGSNTEDAVTAQESSPAAQSPKRSSVNREWPNVGHMVTVNNPWTKEQTTVEVVEAPHRKSGREFLYNGKRYHSPSPMCAEIFGRRVSNGWNCITWKGSKI